MRADHNDLEPGTFDSAVLVPNGREFPRAQPQLLRQYPEKLPKQLKLNVKFVSAQKGGALLLGQFQDKQQQHLAIYKEDRFFQTEHRAHLLIKIYFQQKRVEPVCTQPLRQSLRLCHHQCRRHPH